VLCGQSFGLVASHCLSSLPPSPPPVAASRCPSTALQSNLAANKAAHDQVGTTTPHQSITHTPTPFFLAAALSSVSPLYDRTCACRTTTLPLQILRQGGVACLISISDTEDVETRLHCAGALANLSASVHLREQMVGAPAPAPAPALLWSPPARLPPLFCGASCGTGPVFPVHARCLVRSSPALCVSLCVTVALPVYVPRVFVCVC
jgi:hypothetical protein